MIFSHTQAIEMIKKGNNGYINKELSLYLNNYMFTCQTITSYSRHVYGLINAVYVVQLHMDAAF